MSPAETQLFPRGFRRKLQAIVGSWRLQRTRAYLLTVSACLDSPLCMV